MQVQTAFCLLGIVLPGAGWAAVDFSTQIRPILSENCFFCHGPDEETREAGLRLDEEAAAKEDRDGVIAVLAGDAEASALIQRIVTTDPADVMPPPDLHKVISEEQIALLKQWINEGAEWGAHWSYETVERPEVPEVRKGIWEQSDHPVDIFLAQRLADEGLKPTPPADSAVLVRRVALDLTGLPPTLEELKRFRTAPFEEVVDHYLAAPGFGEHWAGMWLDLARYADSSGYPSDQPREIWAYRDWVIEALNRNQPFDQFTIDQMAGDLLPEPTESQLIATAFHRNTMTQNEGGTSDEEFRVAAVVDRVNTTMAVWMGTTMACAQCHTHKYDPITIQEYYQFYDFLNQTADSDKKDESPVYAFLTAEQKAQREKMEGELEELETRFAAPTPEVLRGLTDWEGSLPLEAKWTTLKPSSVRSRAKAKVEVDLNGDIRVAKPEAKTDTLTLELPVSEGRLEALRLEALADKALPGGGPGHANGNFVLTQVGAEWLPQGAKPVRARYLRLEKISDRYDFLALAEVEVFSGSRNIARQGTARQVSTFVGQADEDPKAALAIDGNPNGDSQKGRSVSITAGGDDQWWELDLGKEQSIDRIVIHRRTDKGQGRDLRDLRVDLLDGGRKPVWDRMLDFELDVREEVSVSGRGEVRFREGFADVTQKGFEASSVISGSPVADAGWAVAGFTGADRSLVLLLEEPVQAEAPGRLVLTLEQNSKWAGHTLGALRLGLSQDRRIERLSSIPGPVLSALAVEAPHRAPDQTARVRDHYVRQVAPELKVERERKAVLTKQLQAEKPVTVPVMQELGPEQQRDSHIQLRGSWVSLGEKVTAGTPAVFHPLPEDAERNRLTLAKWLVSRDNPLTARVTANRLWESLFGVGIVRTSEEFGAQGDLPEHPELLDWLAAELMESGWDLKHLLRLLVTSEAYRQDSATTAELNERDPDNRWLSRGPRFRPTGELLRDQALAVAGLLSAKVGGPPVRPMAPNLGLKTAFGRANDWTTSEGEDRHRRSVYTEVRRNSPYPSFMAFDGVNREVCTLKRNRSNTPLQAFVTLNDPVFVEASQGLARRVMREVKGGFHRRLDHAFEVCVARQPSKLERETLHQLFRESTAHYQQHGAEAETLATDPIGPLPEGWSPVSAAAWTTVTNVILNLDEFLMRR